MTLTYSDLITIASKGKRLHLWALAYPCHDAGLGLRLLRGTWEFIPASELQADPQFATIVQAVGAEHGTIHFRPWRKRE
jgi:hypothetical protein